MPPLMTARRSGLGLLTALAIGAGLGACGGSSTTTVTSTSVSAAAPATSTTSSTPTSTSTSTTTSASGGAATTHRIAVYHPATVIKKNGFVTVLRTSDSIGKVAAFYKGQLARGGWQVREASSNAFHATFNARRDHEGVTIAVYPMGSGAGITVTEHPE
jgi:hypothetical protein